jgi:PAS domain S-box-containing protein
MPLAIPVAKGQGKAHGGPNGKATTVEDLVFHDQHATGPSHDATDDIDRKGTAKATASSSSAVKRKGKHTDVDDITEEERTERRERNREHAKRSRIRKRVILDLLQDQLGALRGENVKLRRMVMERMPEKAGRIFEECTTEESRLLSEHGLSGGMDDDADGDGPHGQAITTLRLKPHPDELAASNSMFGGSSGTCSGFRGISGGKDGLTMPRQRAKILMEPDFRLMESLIHSQQNFVLSDPSLPDNPIVYCSEGFCKLTGYKRNDVLGRNCRFLQGPGTDQGAVDIIRKGVLEGRDISVCLLNYKADGAPFWNQFFVGALRDMNGNVVNFVGIQCEVNTLPIEDIKVRSRPTRH